MAHKPKQRIKRLLDILICVCGLPVALPVGLLLAILIAFDCKASPIYTQTRIGRNGKPFRIYKFRTMVRNADALLRDHLITDPASAAEWREAWKLRKDPRLTRTGSILRKTSLDELPQILNILQGSMTLVGPRPIVEAEKVKYGRYFAEYCQTRPGLTGLWQVSGRNNTTYGRRVACDHYYLNNWSLGLDLWILLRTIPAAIGGNGAY